MAKKDNRSHHDNGGTLNINRKEHSNSFIQHRDPRLNQQDIAKQNLAQNRKEGNENYVDVQNQLAEAAEEFAELDISDEASRKEK